MDIASIIIVVALIVAFWGTVKAFTNNANIVLDTSMSSLAVASQVLPIKAQQLVDEAEHEADQKRADLAKRRTEWETKQKVADL